MEIGSRHRWLGATKSSISGLMGIVFARDNEQLFPWQMHTKNCSPAPYFSQYLHPPLLWIWKINSFKGTVCIFCILFFPSLIFILMISHMRWAWVWEKSIPVDWNPIGEAWREHCSRYSEPVVGSRAIENTSIWRCLLHAIKCWVNSEV